MEIQYKRNLNKSFMVVSIEGRGNYFEEEMLKHTHIQELLPMQMILSDNKRNYWYEVTGCESLDSLVEKKVIGEKTLQSFFSGFFFAAGKISEYLLREDGILLRPDMVYYCHSNGEFRFVYIPGCQESIQKAYHQLFEFLLPYLDHQDYGAVGMGYYAYEHSGGESYSIEDLGREIRNGVWKKEEYAKNYGTELGTGSVSPGGDRGETKEISSKMEKRKRGFFHRLFKGKEKVAVAEKEEKTNTSFPTEYIGEKGKTGKGILKYMGCDGEQDFEIEEFPFVLGTQQDYVNGVIHAGSVSRIHAKIVMENAVYYVEDLNSTNGTFVNEKEVNYKAPEPLFPKDHLWIADQEWVFY